MILTDDFVFIHEPKTGGTFVTEMLSRIYEPVTDQGVFKRALRRMYRGVKKPLLDVLKHGTCRDIPDSHRDKPILATIRNPYDRYVSQYEFAWWKAHPEDYCDPEKIRERYPHFPNLTFEEFIDLNNNLFLLLKNDRFPAEDRLGLQTAQFVRYFFKSPEKVFPAIDQEYIVSEKYKADMFAVHFIHTDRLNRDLYDFLVSVGHAPETVQSILSAPKIAPPVPKILPPEGGRSENRPWQDYYTPELKRQVRRQERLLFAVFPEFDV
jgi:hypothetical protein